MGPKRIYKPIHPKDPDMSFSKGIRPTILPCGDGMFRRNNPTIFGRGLDSQGIMVYSEIVDDMKSLCYEVNSGEATSSGVVLNIY